MVLFYDLSGPHQSLESPAAPTQVSREVPNRSHPFSALLAVYPFLSSLAPYLDHNDLYNLSSACWQFHENLAQYRGTLLALSLRCSADVAAVENSAEGVLDWRSFRRGRRCARDLVNGCLGCKKPFCRNCIYKPTVTQINSRHRRLCSTCRSTTTLLSQGQKRCNCADGSWLCVACARTKVQQDEVSRVRLTGAALYFIEKGNGSIGCFRGPDDCEGISNTGADSVRALDGAPVESGVEIAGATMNNIWVLKDEWKGTARSWCNWCNGVVLSKQDEQALEKLG